MYNLGYLNPTTTILKAPTRIPWLAFTPEKIRQLQQIQLSVRQQYPGIMLLNHPFNLLLPTDNVLLKRGEVLISSDAGSWLDLPLL